MSETTKDIFKIVGIFTAICVAAALMTGCSPSYKEQKGYTELPPELKDCKIYYVRSSDGGGLYITRCPMSTTSTETGGRTTNTVVVADPNPAPVEPVKPEPPKTVVVDGVTYSR